MRLHHRPDFIHGKLLKTDGDEDLSRRLLRLWRNGANRHYLAAFTR